MSRCLAVRAAFSVNAQGLSEDVLSGAQRAISELASGIGSSVVATCQQDLEKPAPHIELRWPASTNPNRTEDACP
jgi:hypothetical protein